MSRYLSYINSCKQLLILYSQEEPGLTGRQPFSNFSKNHFAQFKKFGSRDRKIISHLCYCFFRLGKWGQEIDMEERILTGLFLCSEGSNDLLHELRPDWDLHSARTIPEKIALTGIDLSLADVFPWSNELSLGIDNDLFILSHFKQPNLFLRVRPGYEETVKGKLEKAGISFKQPEQNCLDLPNSTRIDEIIELDKEAVIQDLNSQKVREFFPVKPGQAEKAWDCCAGSGGKSLLLFDSIPSIQLTVSDNRSSILANLKKRFASAGIKKYRSFVADLTSGASPVTDSYDLIICDAPCTGSGTWSRTPEQLNYFDPERILQYHFLQKNILKNIIPSIKQGGHLLYCTCSVFKRENEEIVQWLETEFNLESIKVELLKGYDKKADTLFAALLGKRS